VPLGKDGECEVAQVSRVLQAGRVHDSIRPQVSPSFLFDTLDIPSVN